MSVFFSRFMGNESQSSVVELVSSVIELESSSIQIERYLIHLRIVKLESSLI